MLMIEVNLYIVIDFYLYNLCSNTMEQFETHTHIAKKTKCFTQSLKGYISKVTNTS